MISTVVFPFSSEEYGDVVVTRFLEVLRSLALIFTISRLARLRLLMFCKGWEVGADLREDFNVVVAVVREAAGVNAVDEM